MHSRIFQISTRPIEDDFLTPSSLYDNSSDFADYIGDELEGNERLECIEHLAETLSDLFDYDKADGTLIYKGLGTFLDDWANAIKEQANAINADNILKNLNLYKLESILNRTHRNIYYRFYSEDYNNYAGPASDLIEWLNTLEKGTRLYIGSVIDYHF